jgi:hypothetical protein
VRDEDRDRAGTKLDELRSAIKNLKWERMEDYYLFVYLPVISFTNSETCYQNEVPELLLGIKYPVEDLRTLSRLMST